MIPHPSQDFELDENRICRSKTRHKFDVAAALMYIAVVKHGISEAVLD
jgi:hypothetical protein